MTEYLRHLLGRPAHEQRARLLADQPEGPNRTNWWLAAIGPGTREATTGPDDDEARAAWTALSLVALRAAREASAIDDVEVATREASIAVALSRHGDPSMVHPDLNADRLVRQSLALVPLSPTEAADLAGRWRELPIDTIRSLRTIKNLITPLVDLADRIGDPGTRDELATWLALRPSLP